MEVIHLDNVTKTYRLGELDIHALDHVSLGIAEGEFTALVGPSGSGKTTILQMMGCLDKPDSGSVMINGQDVTRASANNWNAPTSSGHDRLHLPVLRSWCRC